MNDNQNKNLFKGVLEIRINNWSVKFTGYSALAAYVFFMLAISSGISMWSLMIAKALS